MKDSIDTLNKLLKGENMAIEIYSSYIPQVDDESIKEQLIRFAEDHQFHAKTLAERIKLLGGEPNPSTGAIGFMANTKAKLSSLSNMTSQRILKTIYEGEKMGLNKAKEQLKGNLDDESRKLVSQIFETESQHLQNMEEMLNKYLH